MMKKQFSKIAFGILLIAAVFSSCKKDKDEPEENEEEVITTMNVIIREEGGGAETTYAFDDPDGPGGNQPTIDDIVLAAGKAYDVEVVLLNKTTNPPEVVSEEVSEEAEDHRFYYEVSGGANLTVSDFDTDSNGMPVGLTSKWTTGAASTGKIDITLRHYPNGGKEASDPVNSTKSGTDISTQDIGGFSITIQ